MKQPSLGRSTLHHALRFTALFTVLFTLLSSSHASGLPIVCDYVASEPQNEAERLARQASDERWALMEYYASLLPAEADSSLRMPVAHVRVRDIADTWGAPRGGGRVHEGQDIFAARGTPIYAAAPGYVWRMGISQLGGTMLWIVGAGARRYYYAHLEGYPAGLQEGDYVTTDSIIGYVGNSGNAITTPPHLHFGIYHGSRRTCNRSVIDPLPLLVNR